MYQGFEKERIPIDVTHVLVDDGVTTIKKEAFAFCKGLLSIKMGDSVKKIENQAFILCISLINVELSRTIECIEYGAFWRCESLEVLIIPSSLKRLGGAVFFSCRSLRVLKLPNTILVDDIGMNVVDYCDRILAMTHLQYERDAHGFINKSSDTAMNEWLVSTRNSLFPLHSICHDASISAKMINRFFSRRGNDDAYEEDDNEMTALHILALNPFTTKDTLLACYDANESAVLMKDSEGLTPLDYARLYNMECVVALIEALCVHRMSQNQWYDERISKRRKKSDNVF